MATEMDKDAVMEAYDDVRNDSSETNWMVLGYEGNSIINDSTGVEYEEFLSKFTEDARAFGFMRMFMGDEMSRRAKFVFITWSGNDVSPLKRAKMSTDKAIVNSVIQNFAVALQTSELEEITEDVVKEALTKASGANYGTGVRE